MPYLSILSACTHSHATFGFVVGYNLTLSILFVLGLYIFVPGHVRKLHRDDVLQIKWRSFASLIVTAAATITYSAIFCESPSLLQDQQQQQSSTEGRWSTIGLYAIDLRAMAMVLFHCNLLYLGSTITAIVRVLAYRFQRLKHYPNQTKQRSALQDILQTFVTLPLQHIRYNEEERWKAIRNFVMAPITEEIVFRGCMVPPLLQCLNDMRADNNDDIDSIRTDNHAIVCWIAPLFFGVAHIHHGLIQARHGIPMSRVVLMTIFQFTYTTLFGCYTVYALLRTSNLPCVIASHVYCNWRGLPDFAFWDPHTAIYKYRIYLMVIHIVGLVGFIAGFYFLGFDSGNEDGSTLLASKLR